MSNMSSVCGAVWRAASFSASSSFCFLAFLSVNSSIFLFSSLICAACRFMVSASFSWVCFCSSIVFLRSFISSLSFCISSILSRFCASCSAYSARPAPFSRKMARSARFRILFSSSSSRSSFFSLRISSENSRSSARRSRFSILFWACSVRAICENLPSTTAFMSSRISAFGACKIANSMSSCLLSTGRLL